MRCEKSFCLARRCMRIVPVSRRFRSKLLADVNDERYSAEGGAYSHSLPGREPFLQKDYRYDHRWVERRSTTPISLAKHFTPKSFQGARCSGACSLASPTESVTSYFFER